MEGGPPGEGEQYGVRASMRLCAALPVSIGGLHDPAAGDVIGPRTDGIETLNLIIPGCSEIFNVRARSDVTGTEI